MYFKSRNTFWNSAKQPLSYGYSEHSWQFTDHFRSTLGLPALGCLGQSQRKLLATAKCWCVANYSREDEDGCVLNLHSHVRLFATPWTAASQAPLSMEFSRQEYWSGLPFPTPGALAISGIEPISSVSLALAGRFSTPGRVGGSSFLCCCSDAQSCQTLCNPMDCSTPGFPIPHHLPEFAQVYAHCIGDAILYSFL